MSVPGAVFGDEYTVPILGRELLSLVEHELKGCDMRSKENVGNKRFFDQFRPRGYTVVYVTP